MMQVTEFTPYNHCCDIGTINYENVESGHLWCTVCGKQWTLNDRGWKPMPIVKKKPKS